MQVGLGMNIGSVDLLYTQGNLENTGVTTDLAIQGDAFFVVSDGKQQFYTRSGNFQLDATGRLVAATNGFVVQGRMATNGVLNDSITDIILPFGQKSAARGTEKVTVGGNLNAEAAPGATRETTITIYDEQGRRHELTITFTKDNTPAPAGPISNRWNFTVTVSLDGVAETVVSGGTGYVEFNADGTLRGVNGVVPPTDAHTFTFAVAGFPSPQTVTIDFGTVGGIDGLSQFAAPSSAVLREQDGYAMGYLERISIDQTGTITGSFTNGVTLTLGQIVLADFNNPAGLMRVGDNMYAVSANSGAPVLGFAGEGSQSRITSGALEMSNVDLAQEFTNMITAQRGFQSNARVISSSDEMLQELVNLKR